MPGRSSLWFASPQPSPPSRLGGTGGTLRAGDRGWPPPWSSLFGKYSRSDSPAKRQKLVLKYIIMEIHQIGCDGGHCPVSAVLKASSKVLFLQWAGTELAQLVSV